MECVPRRGLIAPIRCLRVPPVAAINSVPIVGGDFEERALADALDHIALNQAAAAGFVARKRRSFYERDSKPLMRKLVRTARARRTAANDGCVVDGL